MTRSLDRILVVDDEESMCRSLKILLEEAGPYDVQSALCGEAALERLDDQTALMIADLNMPGMDGLELLRRSRSRHADLQVIIMTAYSTVKSAIEAMKAGAFEYLIKPFDSEELLSISANALRLHHLAKENRTLRAQLHGQRECDQFLGRSPAAQRVRYLISRAAETDSTVLICGQSGTGKEICARAIHQAGARAEGPFVAVNCSALHRDLLESALFGHERGAFTGAVRTQSGMFERADGGTLFLDEVGDMAPALQAKVLRVLEQRQFERVGGQRTIQVNIRVIAATNKDLPRLVHEGGFREDLYYRLNVIPIDIPPLRERREDIPLLVEHIMARKSEQVGRSGVSLSPEAQQLLCAYDFGGNVRELENILEHALVVSREPLIQPADLMLPGGPAHPSIPLDPFIATIPLSWPHLIELQKDLERQLIERALREHPNCSHEELAQLLGTSRRILELRLSEFGFPRKPRDS